MIPTLLRWIYVAGCAPIRGARVPYWRDPELARRAAMPPPAESEQGAAGSDGATAHVLDETRRV